LDKFGIKKYFTAFKIGWGVKSDYLKELSKELNTRLHDVLFVDDDEFQREEVSRLGVRAVFFEDLTKVLELLNVDNKRINLIKEQESRLKAEKNHKGSFQDFLKECGIIMKVREAKPSDFKRVVQLLNRTNELNATVNRKTLDEIKNNKDLILVAELKDKFGDYGIIAEAIIEEKGNDWFIKDFTVSCRTMGRGIGKALLIYIMRLAEKKGVRSVRGYLKHSSDNWRMRPLYEKRGFTNLGVIDGKEFYEFKFDKYIPEYPEWIIIE
jgi:methoxymalonate biosynthesis protein